jgi:hypothetical protein
MSAWDRREKESAVAHKAFRLYRDMGDDRALSKVAAELDKSFTLIGRWSGKHEWVERVTAWDAEQQRIADAAQTRALEDHQAALVKARLDIEARGLTDYGKLLDKFDDALDKLKFHRQRHKKEKDGGSVQIVEFTADDLLKIAKLRREIEELGRVAVGLPGKISSTHVTTAGEKLPAPIIWTDPLNEDDDIGIGADELD